MKNRRLPEKVRGWEQVREGLDRLVVLGLCKPGCVRALGQNLQGLGRLDSTERIEGRKQLRLAHFGYIRLTGCATQEVSKSGGADIDVLLRGNIEDVSATKFGLLGGRIVAGLVGQQAINFSLRGTGISQILNRELGDPCLSFLGTDVVYSLQVLGS